VPNWNVLPWSRPCAVWHEIPISNPAAVTANCCGFSNDRISGNIDDNESPQHPASRCKDCAFGNGASR